MKRTIIKIDKELCNGCGACAAACHEDAIQMIGGKAALIRDDYCDGLGNCLPVCPTGATTFEEREAAAYDEEAVRRAKAEKAAQPAACPDLMARALRPAAPDGIPGFDRTPAPSMLRQWPVQITLAPVNAPYFDGASLLVAADCTAYAYASFHTEFMAGRVTLIGCPKLDEKDYAEKLTAILRQNDIKSVCVVRMEVPCCCGIEHAVKRALRESGKFIPRQVVTLSREGRIIGR